MVALLVTAFSAPVLAADPAVPAVAGGPPTRAEYVDRLESMCKPRAEATQRAMDGVRKDVRRPKRIPVAASKFDRAASIFGGTVKKIAEVDQPLGDEARLKEWFDYLNAQTSYLERIAAQLHRGKTIQAQRLTGRFIHAGNLSNNVVLAFGFDYCSFKFSRYG